MLRTGMPLISRTRSPVCTEGGRSWLRTAGSNLFKNHNKWESAAKKGWPKKCAVGVGQFFAFNWSLALIKCKINTHVLCSGTYPVTVTRRPLSWLRSVVTVRPRRPAWGGKDTSATMWGLLVRGDADLTVDTVPWRKQWPLQSRYIRK